MKKLGCIALAGLIATAAGAADSERTGKDLTPVGAQKAGNRDGSIPAWTGGDIRAPANWKPGMKRSDPYAGERPLYRVDATNVDTHRARLSAGQIALITGKPGYRMDVYPTHRSCGYAESVYEATRKNARGAALNDAGDLAEGSGAGVLFPSPKNGLEAIWNHKLRYRGEGWISGLVTGVVEKDGNFDANRQINRVLAPAASSRNGKLADTRGQLFLFLNEVTAPASHAGELTLISDTVGKPRDTWLYFPGQRRVRKAPVFSYDAPMPLTQALNTVDSTELFNGSTDRYTWRLVGKQEMLVPYNSYRLIDKTRKYKEVFKGAYVNRDLPRYELHRVWKVEAVLKPGMRHLYARRDFYIDEDSWTVLHEDTYDQNGKLWRVLENTLYMAPELPACVSEGNVVYDLVDGRYSVDLWGNEERETDWLAAREGRLSPAMFTPEELRRLGTR
ncbi:DUF1329 domain-containing protein [Paludibacterium paludis]|uniref:DUF1329 domain-containing protein n=1 Tax=Paludibacterium paludis TaxID=1225769 RepID=A0A918P5K0_9NEIS|nr:DUF1329 domain-containing protein [Paludibacterium paludis]GGY23738.1 hypothetical protein GCM10011289_29260 [Paludibacterium paludis]